MKKTLALLLALAMLLSLSVSAFAAEGDAEEEEELVLDPEIVATMGVSAATAVAQGVDVNDIVMYDHITIGNTTPMRGDFFTSLWGNSTADTDVRTLLNGYNLVIWDGTDGAFRHNPTVVAGVAVTENQAGDHNYTFALADDLFYSDGTRITAWDYAFSLLLELSPELARIGAVPEQKDYLLGGEDYRLGRTRVLAGVSVPADDTITITLNNEYLPFFFEMGLLSCDPYPISVIAPGVRVYDDGNGVYLADANNRNANTVFNAQLLERTVNDPVTGYHSHPSVVTGPYTLESFDGTTAEFAVNPYYKGNRDGVKPLIPEITFTLATNDSMVDGLMNGDYDLLNKAMNAEAVTAGISNIADGEVRMSNYPRSGLSYLNFACEKPALQSAAVRQAIALCMDRDAIVADYTGNYGQRVDGYYGVGQWMVGLVNGTLAPPVDPPEDPNDAKAVAEYEALLEEWENLSLDNLNPWALDTEEAARLLEQDGWKVGSDGVREKNINGNTVKLDLTLVYPTGNAIGESFQAHFVPYLEEVGIRLQLREVAMSDLTEIAYANERDADLIYMASNFDIIYDPSVNFEIPAQGQADRSVTNQTDRTLFELAENMNRTEPGDVLEYVQKWIAFEERFSEVLPAIPVYSNVYFDFYNSLLHDYNIAENVSWSEAIVGAVMADIPEIEVEEAPAEEEEMEIAG